MKFRLYARKRNKVDEELFETVKMHRDAMHLHHQEIRHQMQAYTKHRAELHKYHRHIRFVRPVILLLILFIWYLLFRFAGIKTFSIFLVLLFSLGSLFEIFFLRRLEKRILNPIDKLRGAVMEISQGNYDVEMKCDVGNEIGLLIDSFNEMASKLKQGESVKAAYEENRKTLIANISHDLKTPITSILGYVEAFQDNADISEEDKNKYLKIISRNAIYMDRLVDDLFLYAKLDMQKLDFHFETVDAKSFFRDLMEEFKLELEEKTLVFTYADHAAMHSQLMVDAKRIHQVFRNIIGNAVKHGADKDLAIATSLDEQDGFICIAVKDNGPGIPEEKLQDIFNRFYRIDIQRTKDLMSTGLGLSIAKELIEAHGGKITVTSAVGEGTCFTVLLPKVNPPNKGVGV